MDLEAVKDGGWGKEEWAGDDNGAGMEWNIWGKLGSSGWALVKW